MKRKYPWLNPDFYEWPELLALIEHYMDKAIAVYEGRNRIVFDMGRYVVKLPSTRGGIGDNNWEGSISNSEEAIGNDAYIQYARTRLAVINEIPICLMEKVEPVIWDKHIYAMFPSWVDRTDCGQVGYTNRGRLVCYDWGPN